MTAAPGFALQRGSVANPSLEPPGFSSPVRLSCRTVPALGATKDAAEFEADTRVIEQLDDEMWKR